MPLIVDDGEIDLLARRITDLTGESVGEAVVSALKERLERLERARSELERRRSEEVFLAQVRAISREFRRQAGADDLSSTDHGKLLYDDDGLPA
jgi:hypothetical protein